MFMFGEDVHVNECNIFLSQSTIITFLWGPHTQREESRLECTRHGVQLKLRVCGEECGTRIQVSWNQDCLEFVVHFCLDGNSCAGLKDLCPSPGIKYYADGNSCAPPGLCYSDAVIGSNHHFRLL
jgi:hypothetical protein